MLKVGDKDFALFFDVIHHKNTQQRHTHNHQHNVNRQNFAPIARKHIARHIRHKFPRRIRNRRHRNKRFHAVKRRFEHTDFVRDNSAVERGRLHIERTALLLVFVKKIEVGILFIAVFPKIADDVVSRAVDDRRAALAVVIPDSQDFAQRIHLSHDDKIGKRLISRRKRLNLRARQKIR